MWLEHLFGQSQPFGHDTTKNLPFWVQWFQMVSNGFDVDFFLMFLIKLPSKKLKKHVFFLRMTKHGVFHLAAAADISGLRFPLTFRPRGRFSMDHPTWERLGRLGVSRKPEDFFEEEGAAGFSTSKMTSQNPVACSMGM